VRNGAASRVTLGAAGPRARILPRVSSALAQGATLEAVGEHVARDVASLLPEPDAYLQNLHTSNVMRVLAEVCP
jgi:hypothetical protein